VKHDASTLQLLAWISEAPRTYADTIEVWRTSCPRLAVWEDALADALVTVDRGLVVLTPAGTELLRRDDRALGEGPHARPYDAAVTASASGARSSAS
jgi:hypothetical protein